MHDDLNNIEFEILETIRQVATLTVQYTHSDFGVLYATKITEATATYRA